MHTTAQALKCFQLCCDLTSKYCSIDLVTLDQRTGNVIILAKEEINQDLRKSIEICPPTPNSGEARDQSPPELGDLGGECVSPINIEIEPSGKWRFV